MAEVQYSSSELSAYGIQTWTISPKNSSTLIKLSEDPTMLVTILAASGHDKSGAEVGEKMSQAMALAASGLLEGMKKKVSKRPAGAPSSLVPAASLVPSVAPVDLNSLSFNRKKSGRKAIKDAMTRAFRSYKDFYSIDDSKGFVAVRSKRIVNASGQGCTWQMLIELSVQYFLSKNALKNPESFSLNVHEELKLSISSVTELMKLAKRIITNFLTPDLKPLLFAKGGD